MTVQPLQPSYPVVFDVDPPAQQSRLTVFFRILLALPHLLVLYALNLAGRVAVVIAWFAILFTGRLPLGLFGFILGIHRWQARAMGYVMLLTGAYPPFSLESNAAYPLRFEAEESVAGRDRLTTFFRLLLVIPHVLVLVFVGFAAAIGLILAWFAALVTGRVPDGLHQFLAGATRWNLRVQAYASLLTDRYPPFSLS